LPRDAPRIDWQGPSLWSANELVSRRTQPIRRRAREFLRIFLEAGPRLVNDIRAEARKQRISKNTLNRAKEELEIRSERICHNGERLDYWLLPGQEVPADLSDTPEADELLRKLGEEDEECSDVGA
jgi:hypothetical protein